MPKSIIPASEVYSTVEASPLGQIIAQVQDKLKVLQSKLKNDKSPPSIDKNHAITQVNLSLKLVKLVKKLLAIYNEGAIPHGFQIASLGLYLFRLRNINKDLKNLNVSWLFSKIMNDNLEKAVEETLKMSKIKSVTKENQAEFNQLLIEQIKKLSHNSLKKIRNIPGFNSETCEFFFNSIEEAFKELDYEDFKNSIDKKDLVSYLKVEIKEELFAKKHHNIYKFIITHPRTYIFTQEFMNILLPLLPDNVEKLFSFLNPKALNLELRSGILSDKMNFSIENEQSARSKYRYKVTYHGEENNQIRQVWDLNAIYQSFRADQFKELFLFIINDYLKNYSQSLHVQSEHRKMELVHNFCCAEQIRNSALLKLDELFKDKLSSGLCSEVLVDKIEAINKGLDDLLDWQRRKNNYKDKNFEYLIAEYPELLKRVEEAKNDKLDISFLNLPLPASIIFISDDSINSESLNIFLLKYANDLESYPEKLRARRDELQNQLDSLSKDKIEIIELVEKIVITESNFSFFDQKNNQQTQSDQSRDETEYDFEYHSDNEFN